MGMEVEFQSCSLSVAEVSQRSAKDHAEAGLAAALSEEKDPVSEAEDETMARTDEKPKAMPKTSESKAIEWWKIPMVQPKTLSLHDVVVAGKVFWHAGPKQLMGCDLGDCPRLLFRAAIVRPVGTRARLVPAEGLPLVVVFSGLFTVWSVVGVVCSPTCLFSGS